MKLSKTNKSKAIREAHSANPGAKPSEIVKILATKNINVSPQLVSNVLTRLGTVKRRRGARPHETLTVPQLEAAAQFAKSVGGLQQAHDALQFLSRLR
jgi:hypothetical protein